MARASPQGGQAELALDPGSSDITLPQPLVLQPHLEVATVESSACKSRCLGGSLSAAMLLVQHWAHPWYLAWPLVVSGGTLRWVPQCAPLGSQPREPQAHATGDDTHLMGPSAQPARPHGTMCALWQGLCGVLPAPKPGPGLGARGSHKCSTHVEMEAQRGAMTCPRTHSETGLNPLMPSRCSSRGKVRWRPGHVGPTWFQPLRRDIAATCGALAVALSRQSSRPRGRDSSPLCR